VHPGYGFLSENADFAEACADAAWSSSARRPRPSARWATRRWPSAACIEAGVPCAPGYLGEDQATNAARRGRKLGLPLLVKAVAGGGGRGMRLVRDLRRTAEALAGARREALSAFGDGTLMLERLIDDGRHIEIQVFADTHGHARAPGRARLHGAAPPRQKVIEEAPSPIVTPAMRAAMGRDAVAAARPWATSAPARWSSSSTPRATTSWR
jgi:geranyl-CoA carboxylase alpha subunit